MVILDDLSFFYKTNLKKYFKGYLNKNKNSLDNLAKTFPMAETRISMFFVLQSSKYMKLHFFLLSNGRKCRKKGSLFLFFAPSSR